MPCSFIINSSSFNDTWISNKISSYLFANRNRAKINKFVITKFVLQISDLCNEWIPDSRCLVKSLDSDIFIHVGAVWVPICKRELHDARPPEPGHASDHYRFLRWTKSESGCQATTIPWKVELAAVVFFARQLTLSNSCPPLVMESIYELSAGRETCLGCTPLPSYFNTKMENFLLHANLDWRIFMYIFRWKNSKIRNPRIKTSTPSWKRI